MADILLTELVSMEQQAGQGLVREKLNDLGQRQLDLEHALAEVQQELDSLDRESVDTGAVRAALGQVKDLFGALKPYEQRELMQLVLQRAEVNEREITLDVYALTEASSAGKVGSEGDMVRMPPKWLTCLDSNLPPKSSQFSLVGPTKPDKIKNFHTTDTIDAENSRTRGRPIWVHSSQVGKADSKWVCHVVPAHPNVSPGPMNGSILLRWGLHVPNCELFGGRSKYNEAGFVGPRGL